MRFGKDQLQLTILVNSKVLTQVGNTRIPAKFDPRPPTAAGKSPEQFPRPTVLACMMLETPQSDLPEVSRRQRSFWQRMLRPTREERRRMLHRQMVGALALAYGLVIFAWAWPQDYRQEAAWYAGTAWIAFLIRTFLFWGGWLVVAGAVAAGCYGWRKIALAALPLIAFTLGPTLATWWPRHTSPAAGEQGLKVMTLNLLASNDERRPVFQAIRDADPDVLFLQELTESWDAALRAELDDLFPHRYSEPRDDCFGMAVFSELPLEDVRFDLAL